MTPWGSDPPKRRDKMEIMAEILHIAAEGALKTQIMYSANLSYTQLKNYLGLMLELDLLEKTEENKRDIYESTDKGLDFLERYRQIAKLLKNENNNPKNNVKTPPPHLLKKG